MFTLENQIYKPDYYRSPMLLEVSQLFPFLRICTMSCEVKPACWRLSQFDVTFMSLSGHSWSLLPEFNKLLIRDTEKGQREGKKRTWEGEREQSTFCVKRAGRRTV